MRRLPRQVVWLRSRRVRLVAVLLSAALTVARPARAQDAAFTPSDGERPLLSDRARVSLVTVLPGRLVYNVFGHNALRIVDPERGLDITYNYGTFHFGNPVAFAAKFVYGDLNYRLARGDYGRMVAYYPAVEGRPLVEQWLDLDAGQREELFRFLEWNARPENAFYRYDFYYDNCATRIRDLLESVLGPSLQVDAPDPGVSMRQLLDPYLTEKPFLHLGMDFGQGVKADVQASVRDALFLPDHLASWAAGARRLAAHGEVSLVSSTDSIGWTAERVARQPSPPWPSILLGALLVLILAVSAVDAGAGRESRWWLDVPLFGFLGVAGLFVAFLWFVSLHEVGRHNVNLVWALPTHLGLAWALARHSGGRWVVPYLWLTAGLATVFVVGWPLWTQEVPFALVLLAAAAGARSAGLAVARQRPGRAAGFEDRRASGSRVGEA